MTGSCSGLLFRVFRVFRGSNLVELPRGNLEHPRIADGKAERIDPGIRLGLAAVGHVFVENAGAQVVFWRKHQFETAANEPRESEILALTALDSSRIQHAGTTARPSVQTPFLARAPQLHRRRTHDCDIVRFGAVLNPRAEQGKAVAKYEV